MISEDLTTLIRAASAGMVDGRFTNVRAWIDVVSDRCYLWAKGDCPCGERGQTLGIAWHVLYPPPREHLYGQVLTLCQEHTRSDEDKAKEFK